MTDSITVPPPQETAGVARRSTAPSGHRARPGGPLPDGPQLGAVAQSTWFHRDPLGMTRRMQATYGDVFTLRFATEGTTVAVCAPEAVDQLLTSDPALAHAGEGRQRILGMVAKRSVLGADAGQHREARGRVADVFTVEAIDRHRDAIAQVAARHVEALPRDRPFRLLPRLRALVDEVFAALIVGVRAPDRARALAAGVQRMLWTPGNPPLSPPGPDDGLLGQAGKALFARRAAPVRALLAEELRARRAAGDVESRDVLGAMLRSGLDEDAMLDEILPLLMAGQEPPAAGLTWVLDRLARDPALAAHVVEHPDDARSDAIRREALRLRPAVAAIVRRLMAPLRVAGHDLPGGTVTMIPIPLLHRDPRCWRDPETFDAERFLGDPGGEQHPALLPFGGGMRRCLGEHLAHAQLDIVLPAVLSRVELRPLWPAPERMVVRGTVLVPHRSAPVVARAR